MVVLAAAAQYIVPAADTQVGAAQDEAGHPAAAQDQDGPPAAAQDKDGNPAAAQDDTGAPSSSSCPRWR